MEKICHFLQVPFSGLGIRNGYRGDNWLKNRIEIFKKYVLPSIFNQSNKNFILWICWRPEEKENPIIREFAEYLNKFRDLNFIFTYTGIFFWDDKYSDEKAEARLRNSLNKALPLVKDIIGEAEWVLVSLQPSDDMFLYNHIDRMQEMERMEIKAVGYKQGYIMDMATKEISEYDPKTTPPFYTIYYPRDVFLDTDKHMDYIGKCRSHEYVGDFLPYKLYEERGFIVGCHTENISTSYNIPYKGRKLTKEEAGNVMRMAGILDVPPLKLNRHWKRYYFKLPHWLRRKIRYYIGEKFYAKIWR